LNVSIESMIEDGREHDQLPHPEEIKDQISKRRPILFRKEIIHRFVFFFLVVGTIIGAVSLPLAIIARQGAGSAAYINPNEMESVILQAVLRQEIATTATEYTFPPRSIQQRALNLVKKEEQLSEELTIQLYSIWCFYLATEHVQTDLTDEIYGLGTVPAWFDSWTNDGPDACLFFGVRCNSKGIVTELNMSSNGLSGALPQELTLLSSLRKLELRDNYGLGQGGVPSWLEDFPFIELIDLRGCNYSGKIPDELCVEQMSDYMNFYADCTVDLACC